MGILNELLSRVETVNAGLQFGTLVRDAIVRHSEDILELQRIQLLQGLSSSGEDIRPYYSEDLKPSGYFYSVESAGRYSAWKVTGIAYPYSGGNRNPDAPNLYINGQFHSELGVEFGSETVGVVPTTGYAREIVLKYGLSTFGLMPQNWSIIFWDKGAYDELLTEIKAKLYA